MKSGLTMTVLLGSLLLVPAAAMAGDKAKMDTNGDGSVSAAEHAAGAKAMFTSMDANSDGNVTAAEMDVRHAAKAAGKPDRMKMTSAEKIKTIDTNGDGQLSAAEHAAGSQAMFTKMDANGDGNLTAAEMKAGHEAAMAGTR
ncbi:MULTISPECIES: hypothetical protein [unclassified Lysobacter]|uniref:EF-hand domain-containing protein n=1 Tax=unclassified Lysobacter TaxID=2635362 RepID=UPI001C217AF9|nr:hypothetical protein [Lysobacter sp. MMG2]MBU8975187.1 hypothetical protein [Lysobacter sp. MMG2]